MTYDVDGGTVVAWITSAELTIRAQRARHAGHDDSAGLTEHRAIRNAMHEALRALLSRAGYAPAGDIAATGHMP